MNPKLERHMRRGSGNCLLGVELAIGLFLAALMAQPGHAFAQAPAGAPAAGDAEQEPVSPGASAAPAPSPPAATAPADSGPGPSAPAGSEPAPPPGVPSDTAAVTLELAARPVAYLHVKGEWANAFKFIREQIAKIDEAIGKAGLTQAGHPFAVFLETNDQGFEIDAMVPIAGNPKADELPGGVKIGESPSGKVIKFLHRGSYDDIDSTYDLITAFLDEKGLESQNRFIEEYLTDTAEPDDAGLEADIYVFLK
jgi:effector-binding domain-containing protein